MHKNILLYVLLFVILLYTSAIFYIKNQATFYTTSQAIVETSSIKWQQKYLSTSTLLGRMKCERCHSPKIMTCEQKCHLKHNKKYCDNCHNRAPLTLKRRWWDQKTKGIRI